MLLSLLGSLLGHSRELELGSLRRSAQTAWSILLLTISIPSLFGQTASTGSVMGRVVDPSGALLPGAIVQLASDRLGESRSQTTDREGNFRFSLLPPGIYELQVTQAGFAPLLQCRRD
jgi:Carboxypeptidase regulatory-like domain